MELPSNVREGLESELRGLENRLTAAGDSTPVDTVAMLERRIGEVQDQLGIRPPRAKRAARGKEARPAGKAEARPG